MDGLQDDELGRKRFICYKAILAAAAFVRYPQNPFVTCLIRFVASYSLFKFLCTVEFFDFVISQFESSQKSCEKDDVFKIVFHCQNGGRFSNTFHLTFRLTFNIIGLYSYELFSY